MQWWGWLIVAVVLVVVVVAAMIADAKGRKMVSTSTAETVGRIEQSGALTQPVLTDVALAGVRLRGVGSYAVVVTAE